MPLRSHQQLPYGRALHHSYKCDRNTSVLCATTTADSGHCCKSCCLVVDTCLHRVVHAVQLHLVTATVYVTTTGSSRDVQAHQEQHLVAQQLHGGPSLSICGAGARSHSHQDRGKALSSPTTCDTPRALQAHTRAAASR